MIFFFEIPFKKWLIASPLNPKNKQIQATKLFRWSKNDNKTHTSATKYTHVAKNNKSEIHFMINLRFSFTTLVMCLCNVLHRKKDVLSQKKLWKYDRNENLLLFSILENLWRYESKFHPNTLTAIKSRKKDFFFTWYSSNTIKEHQTISY